MKKTITSIIALLLIVVMSVSLVGCSDTSAPTNQTTPETTTQPEPKKINGRFIEIEDQIGLVYDYETFIVFYLTTVYTDLIDYIPCPYFSSNGYQCHYNPETGEISEIVH